MNKRYFPFLISLSIIVVALFFLNSGKLFKKGKDKYEQSFREEYKILTPAVPLEVSFANETVPLDLFFVRERFERELLINTYWHNSTIQIFKNANRYFPIIEPILKKYDVPDDFKYLALIESRLMNVVSPAGATGFWQFMKSTAAQYGLKINDEIDERYHIEKSTEAACKYLLDAYKEFGSWTLVAASYNAGIERIKKAVENQKEENYFLLYLNSETSRYLYRILAMKEIFEHPTHYGFYLLEIDLYPPLQYETYKVEQEIEDLAAFAKSQHIDYLSLKIFNPWLRAQQLSADSENVYLLKIPDTLFLWSAHLRQEEMIDLNIFHDSLTVDEL